ncbi:hypothetical protein RRG08_016783 [Elysia crispata]|uniref:Uncharacterized protein n=1 Tax=Elysia crispata TaxID=231223 RepID=A0AAE1DPP9_9GAST|nr:hypothetical protein RRG08_016783 [Elysia crispata]
MVTGMKDLKTGELRRERGGWGLPTIERQCAEVHDHHTSSCGGRTAGEVIATAVQCYCPFGRTGRSMVPFSRPGHYSVTEAYDLRLCETDCPNCQSQPAKNGAEFVHSWSTIRSGTQFSQGLN